MKRFRAVTITYRGLNASATHCHTGTLVVSFALSCMVLMPISSWGQSSWPTYPNNTAISVTSVGNVGIGTAAPSQQLQLTANLLLPSAVIDTNGNLFFGGDTSTGAVGMRLFALPATNGYPATGFIDVTAPVATQGLVIRVDTTSGGTPRMVVLANGSVGIGTLSPQHLLHVAGTIGAEEVIVSSSGADYVFDPGHRLTPLSEVAGYINEHHHLPDIPSASEMQQKGAGIGDMQAKLLAKIEELTLHMIQAEERSNRLDQQNRDLQERITRLESKNGQGPDN